MSASRKISICVVVGTRPEVVKMCPVLRVLSQSETLRAVLLSTGQQRELLQQALADSDLTPNIDLDLMRPRQSLTELTSNILVGVSEVIARQRPAAVLVHGDTTTAFGAALAAFYQKVPIGHVEAGLRTYDFTAPWPEEMNRRLVDPLCSWCFAPTELAKRNLLNEFVPVEKIHVTGNTVVDALLQTRDSVEKQNTPAPQLLREIGVSESVINCLAATNSAAKIILVTGHRRESFGIGFENICSAIREIVDARPEVTVIYPVHLNPNVQEPVARILGNHPRIQLIAPVAYERFVGLMALSHFILTDSGGIQEEAPSMGKPVLVMREATERPEGIEAGTSTLVGTRKEQIVAAALSLLGDANEYLRRSQLTNPYGDGHAASRIVAVLENDLKDEPGFP